MDSGTRDSEEGEYGRTLYTGVKCHDETCYYGQNVYKCIILKITDNGKLLNFIIKLFTYFKVLHSD